MCLFVWLLFVYRAVRHLVLGVVLLAGRGGVAAADHGDDARGCRLHDVVHERLGASLERGHLEHAHRAVPDQGLGGRDGRAVELHRLGAAVQAHEASMKHRSAPKEKCP